MKIIGNDWDFLLEEEFNKDYYQNLRLFLDEEYKNHQIYPPAKDIFNALRYTSYADSKVLILGQDPYHKKGQAMGLSFAVPKGVDLPPSLINIYKEIHNEYGYHFPRSGDLSSWTKQGVLLLNSVLTVREASAGSHAQKGWEILTDRIVELLDEKDEPFVFILWGNYARKKKALLHNSKHLILESAHPSPLSAYHGFFGNNHFLKTNEYLKNHNLKEIDWHIYE